MFDRSGNTHHIYFNVFYSHFCLELPFLCLFFLLFSPLHFDFTFYIFILVLYSVFEKNKMGSFVIDQIGNLCLLWNF